MLIRPDYETARNVLLENVRTIGTECIPLGESTERILACDLVATQDVPPFPKSAYDGYAFRSSDTTGASKEAPAVFDIIECIPAGSVPLKAITPGTAAKVLTGAPVPDGADAVVAFEQTSFSETSVSVFAPFKSGANIVRIGEDVEAGAMLAAAGTSIDAGLAGSLAALGIYCPSVYKKPVVGIVSTGNEIVEIDETVPEGKIRNTYRFVFTAALQKAGCTPIYLGSACDSVQDICDVIERGIDSCDAILLTGGVSAGDLDKTPDAMQSLGAVLLVQGVSMKPGMACAYGLLRGKLLLGLSGNPASALTNFYTVCLPAIRKLCGHNNPLPRFFTAALGEDFQKSSHSARLLRGTLDISSGTAVFSLPKSQGNAVISSAIGCDAFAIIPAESGPVAKGTILKGFSI